MTTSTIDTLRERQRIADEWRQLSASLQVELEKALRLLATEIALRTGLKMSVHEHEQYVAWFYSYQNTCGNEKLNRCLLTVDVTGMPDESVSIYLWPFSVRRFADQSFGIHVQTIEAERWYDLRVRVQKLRPWVPLRIRAYGQSYNFWWRSPDDRPRLVATIVDLFDKKPVFSEFELHARKERFEHPLVRALLFLALACVVVPIILFFHDNFQFSAPIGYLFLAAWLALATAIALTGEVDENFYVWMGIVALVCLLAASQSLGCMLVGFAHLGLIGLAIFVHLKKVAKK